MTDPSRMKLLIAYGSRGGSTREVAEGIARVLRARHLHVDVRAVTQIHSLNGYGGFVIGSGVYEGSWSREVTTFVRQHRYTLAHGAVWLFSVAAFGDSHALLGRMVRKWPRELAEFTEVLQPRGYRVFAGIIDPQRWSRIGRALLRAFGGRDGDNRDWPDIARWAEAIADAVIPHNADAHRPSIAGCSRTRRSLRSAVAATRVEKTHPLPGDRLIEDATLTLTHAITIDAAPSTVWPWLVQMGAGTRAGWYSYDLLDNGGKGSVDRIVPALQTIEVGTLFPAVPGASDGFHVVQCEPRRTLVLGWRSGGELLVTWAFALVRPEFGRTRLLVRVRASKNHRPLGLPRWLGLPLIRVVHFWMQRKQLLGIRQRAESYSTAARLAAKAVA